MAEMMDLTGQRYGILTVIKYCGVKKYKGGGKTNIWLCKCDCGNESYKTTSNLRSGTTKSCGCLRHRKGKDNPRTKHGECNTRLYKVYTGIKKRCNCKSDKYYAIYGGRNIKLCEEWSGEHGYENFRDWALANGFDENKEITDCTIDRIDVNKDYSPDNCRWVGAVQQANNRSTNKYITYKGVTHTIAEWSRITNVPYSRLQGRLKKGWPIDDIFEIGKLKANRKYQKIEKIQVDI